MRQYLFLIGAFLFIILLMGFIAPKQFQLRESVLIDAPMKEVYEELASLKKINNWMGDLNTGLIHYSGTEGTIGSTCEWDDNQIKGQGKSVLIAKKPFRHIEIKEERSLPWQQTNLMLIDLINTQNETELEINVFGQSPFPFNIVHLFKDPREKLHSELQINLTLLKQKCESDGRQITIGNYIGKTTFVQSSHYCYLTDFNTAAQQMSSSLDNYSAHWPDSFDRTHAVHILYHFQGNQLNYNQPFLCIAADGFNAQNCSEIKLPSSRAIVFPYSGTLDGLKLAHRQLNTYFEENDYRLQTMVEIKINQNIKSFENESGELIAELIYRIVKH